MTLNIKLDSVKTYRNKHEWRNIPRARCGDFERIGDGWIIKLLCKDMMDAGIPGDEMVHVFRGEKPCIMPRSLNSWVNPPKKKPQPEWLKKQGAAS